MALVGELKNHRREELRDQSGSKCTGAQEPHLPNSGSNQGLLDLSTLYDGIGRTCASSWPAWWKETMVGQQNLQENRRKATEARAGATPSW